MLIDLSGPPVELPREIVRHFSECLIAAARSGDIDRPAPPLGVDALRVELGRALDDNPDEIAVTAGVRSAIPVFGSRLAATLVEVPTFEGVPLLLRHLGGSVRRGPWDEVLSSSEAIWITTPGRNPDGAALTGGERSALDASPSRFVVVNETYRWCVPGGRPFEREVAYVGSLGKAAGPGLPFGWIRGPVVPKLPDQAYRFSSPPAVVQSAWARFLEQGGLEGIVRQMRASASAKAAFAAAAGDALVERRSGPGLSLLAHLGAGADESAVARRLREHDVVVNEGADFGAAEPSLRLCFIGVDEEAAVIAAEQFRAVFADAGGTP